ncbi:MAG: diaminopimelate epimerase [Natronospirillum sp.]|nr:diaminopimelate epimerase [Natronospirillum sp.]MCH8551478.1 diaminopimelate epimerase [Natronospirillum sp.]
MRFTKMHGLGNDFMVIDGVTQDVTLTREQVRAWGDRQFGVGFDQLLLVQPPESPDVAFRYRIYNADGAEVEQCGNGARCFAAFVRRQGLTASETIPVQTAAGRLELQMLADGQVRVNMGVPRLQPEDVPFKAAEFKLEQPVSLADGRTVSLTPVSMGNPHAVLLVDREPDDALVHDLGPILESHEAFPEHANVGFLHVHNPTFARLRVFERGVGETLACGSGACAALVAARLRGTMDEAVTLQVNGGQMTVSWAGEGQPVYMTGPASFVYDGEINQEA